MALTVYTSQFRYGGADRLDITRGSKRAEERIRDTFAPSWKLLNRGLGALKRAPNEKAKQWAWLSYEAGYKEAMRISFKHRRSVWNELLARDRVVLVCFCSDHNFCHRRVLADLLVACGATYAGEIPVDHQFPDP